MEPTIYSELDNSEVTGLYFEEPMEDGTTLMVFYEGDRDTQFGVYRPTRAAEFNVEYEYYNNLVVAEESENMLEYLDCLNDVFANMTFVKEESNSFVSLHLPYNSEENKNVFNNIFNVDGLNSNVSKQIGFTPYYVKLENSEIINQNPITHSYTYKIYGVSYCETKSESTAYIKNSDKLIMSENYDNNHLKAYNRVMTFSSIAPTDILYEELRLSGDIYMIIDGVNYPYTVTNEYFGEVNVFEDYFKMQDGKFDYEKPEDLNLDDYQK